MNIQHIRESLKLKWVSYYHKNRSWLVKMRVWGTYDAVRRPSSGFILATLSILEPQLEQILPFIVELNSNPDNIVTALGLNFNPEEQLYLIESNDSRLENQLDNESLSQALPNSQPLSPSVVATEIGADYTIFAPFVAEPVELKSEPPSQLEYKPLIPNVSKEEEGNSMPLVATPTEVENKNNSAPLAAFFSPEVENKSRPTSSVAVATTNVESKTTPVQTLGFFSPERDSKSKSVPSVITTVECKSKPLVAVATPYVESKSRFVSMAAFLDSAVQSNSLPSFVLDTNVDSKGRVVTTPQEDIQTQMNLPPPKRVRSLVNWIDEFCQGMESDREEPNFIP